MSDRNLTGSALARAVETAAHPVIVVDPESGRVVLANTPATKAFDARRDLRDVPLLALAAHPADDPMTTVLDLVRIGAIESCLGGWCYRTLGPDRQHLHANISARAVLDGATRLLVVKLVPSDVERTPACVRGPLAARGSGSDLAHRLAGVEAALASMKPGAWRQTALDGSTYEDLQLSTRQREVLDLVERGFRVQQIARELCLSQGTVRNHLVALFRKLDVSSQAELVDALHRRRAQSLAPTASAT